MRRACVRACQVSSFTISGEVQCGTSAEQASARRLRERFPDTKRPPSLSATTSQILRIRETIAAYLRTARAVTCDARQIMVVAGSQQALDLCARVLLDPGAPVWIEDPGYVLLRSTLIVSGCHLVPVPVDHEGLNVAEGIRLCRNATAAFVTP